MDDVDRAAEILRKEFAGISVVSEDGALNIAGETDPSEINAALVNAGVKVYELKNGSVSFEDYFIERLGK